MTGWQNRSVLVTGAGGFIGSHLVAALADRGAEVRALVRYNSRSDWGNLRYLSADQLDSVDVLLGDIGDAGFVHRAVEGCDCVFHLAALIGIPYSYVAPISYVTTNVIGTLNILDAVRAHDVPRLVHTSTSEVYGTAVYEPIDEKHPLQGQSPYSATKIAADKLAESYHLSFGVPAVTVRPFNTYGPRQSARAVIPTIISQLLAGRDTIELGSLEPTRDLTFVADTVSGFLALADCDGAIGKTVNLGSGKTISVGDLAALLAELVNPDARVVSRQDRVRPSKSEVMRLICDRGQAEALCGWQPRHALREGLSRTVEFIRAHPDLYRADTYTI